MITELHLLQSFPVSNLNRDDVGQPKTATFGGYVRGRISSQSLKRAARLLFDRYGLDRAEVGVRTKRLLDSVVAALHDKNPDEARPIVIAALQQLGFGLDANKGLTEYLLFVGRESVERLADHCRDNWDKLQTFAEAKTEAQKKKIKPDRAAQAEIRRILDASRAADIALFGRMIADNKDLNVDAASQVAHAISTHVVLTEFDFYTAVDDFKPEDESGADMLGTIDFNTACYYRYANVDLTQLAKNLQGDVDLAKRTARAWLLAFVNAVPGGKQNSMAARTMPDTLLGVVREHGAWNLANAFLNPITDADVMQASTTALVEHFGKLRGFYGDDQIRAAVAASVSGKISDVAGVQVVGSLNDFTTKVIDAGKYGL
ncbi:type I-E CRISPR-associated protein Cas7/Cse4/CasC [Spongiactinospora gelatinilytica]|uniref:Type I-E CRISPR-associated protein Cas7/Cse4/CasC n=1 Tax=Spongiactinospora gelatinilytica TaxID=2666298 RepID=A0A2W2GUY5_9ACTN|nr:type I-E CRISPR-associated protein Cas7/Cse4/CasC [Spongiactinospora gelatinilytica]PZG41390.1 type I-E CRISPR-associated protein Cas7/Cse4/CasC [Spongiactinospora gelatinilytica]